MIKLPITYKDFNDVEHTEDFYFNMTKSQLLEIELKSGGTYKDMLQEIIDTNDPKRIIEVFTELVNLSYGEKSEDGKTFYKSKDITAAFEHTAAYNEFFYRLVTDAPFAADFVNGVMPPDLVAQVQAEKSASQQARERSEAQMQGRRAKVETTASVIQQVETPPLQIEEGQITVANQNNPFVAPAQILDVNSTHPAQVVREAFPPFDGSRYDEEAEARLRIQQNVNYGQGWSTPDLPQTD